MKYCKFLENYRIYTANNETPEMIHVWTGLSTLAGACEKRLWLDRGIFKLYMNMYIILLAPPGVCAKSTSISLGARMLKETGFNTFEDSVLKEKIIQEMCELEKAVEIEDNAFYHSSITYIASELNILLSSGIDMVKFLVNIWDKEDKYVYKTKNSGVYEVNNPFFNLIGAAVPEWFGSNVLGDVNSTGFLARVIIVYEDKKRKKEPDPTPTSAQLDCRKVCIDILTQIGSMYGEIILTPKATTFYHDWYMKQDIDISQDYRIVSYLERKIKTHVLKVASLCAIGDLRKIVEVKDLEFAISLLNKIEPKLKIAVLLSASNKIAPFVRKISQLLDSRNGVVLMKDVINMFYTELNKEQFKELIALVEDLGHARTEVRNSKRYLVTIKH